MGIYFIILSLKITKKDTLKEQNNKVQENANVDNTRVTENQAKEKENVVQEEKKQVMNYNFLRNKVKSRVKSVI